MAQQLNSEIRGVWLDGVQLPVKDGTVTVQMGVPEKTAQLGSGRVLGYSEAIKAGSVSMTIVFVKGTKLRATYDATGTSELRLQTDQGDELLMLDVALTTDIEWSAGEGDTSLEYTGSPIEEI